MKTARVLGADSQAVFNVLMGSISEPGTIRQISHELRSPEVPDIAWLALALADVDIAVAVNPAADGNTEPSLAELVLDATGATITDLHKAWIALLDSPTPAELGSLPTGSALEPELGARAAIAVHALSTTATSGSVELTLSGPGIPGQRKLSVAGGDTAVLRGIGQASGHFPAGIDTWLFDSTGQVAAIPRSTIVAIESEEN